MDDCPSIDRLMAYAEGHLDDAVADEIEVHVDGCAACASVAAHAAREAHAHMHTPGVPSTAPKTSIDDAPPARIGRYAVLQRIGAGGMGVVLAAYDPRLDRVVAIKLLRADAEDRDAATRLRREARALATLSHPNVIAVFECGTLEHRDGIYIVMERVVGETLRRWCTRAPRSTTDILAAYLAAAQGLAAAHAAGLVHRDFKPDNVLVGEDGRVRVGDFGLARAIGITHDDDASGGSSVASARSSVAGTPSYMAPEQRAGAEVGPAADQYAFCVALWEALTGARPPDGDARRLTPRIRRALERGLQADPHARWPSLEQLMAALHPARRPWALASVGATSVAAVLVTVLATPPPPDPGPCGTTRARLDAIWTDDRRAAIEARASATLAAQTTTAIDRWTERWHARAATACVDEPALLADDGCLGLAAVELDTVLGLIERTRQLDVTLRTAIGELVDPQTCRDDRRHTTSDPIAVAAVRAQLAQATALSATHRFDGALSLGAAAVAAARALDASVLADALQRFSRIQQAAGDYLGEAASTEQGFLLAESIGDEPLAAALATSRVFTASVFEHDGDTADVWARHAAAAIDRMDPAQQEIARARLLAARARTSADRGRFEQAIVELTGAIEVLEPSGEVGPSELAALYNGLGTAQLAGDREAALANFEHALTISRAHHGDLHPEVAMLLNNIGGLHYYRGELELAAARLGEAARLLEVILGEHHPQVAGTYMNYGLAQAQLGDGMAARASLARASELFARSLGPDHPDAAMARINLGSLELDEGAIDEAEVEFRGALLSLESSVGPDHEFCGNALRGLAEVAMARGQGELAVAFAARAVRIDARSQIDVNDRAGNLLQLAQAQRLAGDEVAALAAARDALARLRGAEADAELVATVEAFLAEDVNAGGAGSG